MLLRLFLEFNLLQNYFYKKSNDEKSYRSLEKYFKDQINPGWNTLIKRSLPENKFCKTIKADLKTHHKKLSKTRMHPYHPEGSPKKHSGFSPGASLDGVFFWHSHLHVLKTILDVYYINFPMLFHPVDPIKKFGFNGPVGLFVDETVGHIIKMSLSNKDYRKFYDFSKRSQTTQDLLQYYNSNENLSDEQIIATWDKKEEGEFESIIVGYAKKMSKSRVIKEVLSLRQ